MATYNVSESTDRVSRLVRDVQRRGVKLWAEHGRLYCEVPKGALSGAEVERLRACRDQIVATLQQSGNREAVSSSPTPRRPEDRVPLTFTQLLHWHSSNLRERRSLRATAAAMRIHGRLHLELLRESIQQVVRRHEALRTQIAVVEGSPTQQVFEVVSCDLQVEDLSMLPESVREAEASRLIVRYVGEPIDVAKDPLFGARLLKLHDDEHILIVAMEHIIGDGHSLSILWRNLFANYEQALTGRAASLPEIPVQLGDFAVWQRKAHKAWMQKRGMDWNARLKGCPAVRLPTDEGLAGAVSQGWATVRVNIDKSLKSQLQQWCRHHKTTLPISVFTAYVALVLRWCATSETVIQYQTTGRVSPKIENTIGYFASVLCLRIQLGDFDRFSDLAGRVTKEYCAAYAHADFCYMATQVPRPEFSRNTAFNWIPQIDTPMLARRDEPMEGIRVTPVPFENPVLENLELDADPWIALHDTHDGISGTLHFPRGGFRRETIERLGKDFLMFIKILATRPDMRISEIPLSY